MPTSLHLARDVADRLSSLPDRATAERGVPISQPCPLCAAKALTVGGRFIREFENSAPVVLLEFDIEIRCGRCRFHRNTDQKFTIRRR